MAMKKQMSTRTMVLAALMTALVVVLQYMGSFIHFGPFSISLVLIPIVIGAILCGKGVGAWLGFIFGVVVIVSGDAAAFMTVNAFGTIVTVLLKGTACGFVAGLVHELLTRMSLNRYASAVIAAIICPVVNTGIFLIGCLLFFMETIAMWAGDTSVAQYMILVLVGGNFVFELAVNVIFAPAIVQIIKIAERK